MKQFTIKNPVEYRGIGLHTGNKTTARFLPAEANFGIQFLRKDVPGSKPVPAKIQNVIGVVRGTTIALENKDARIHTVEHLCSAIVGLGIDNVLIEVDANEPPVADGSALPFAQTLQKAGLQEQDAEKKVWICPEEFIYRNNETEIKITPADDLILNCKLLFDHPMIGQQQRCITITPETFLTEIAPARTFCFDYEVEALKRNGLAKGGSLDNAVVVGFDQIYNQEKLRFEDEFVRHKMLDFLGDLSLLGCAVRGRIDAVKVGHGHNVNFVRQITEKYLKA